MRAVLWVPGKFSLTNKMLDNLRAGSRYQGSRPPRGWVNAFEQETQAIRLATKAAVRGDVGRLTGFPGQRCSVEFAVFGHRKHDPDAWYLLGKAALDGLVDAHVFASDRHEVWATMGRVMQSELDESGSRRGCLGYGDVIPVGVPGVAVCLNWALLSAGGDVVSEVCGHA